MSDEGHTGSYTNTVKHIHYYTNLQLIIKKKKKENKYAKQGMKLLCACAWVFVIFKMLKEITGSTWHVTWLLTLAPWNCNCDSLSS